MLIVEMTENGCLIKHHLLDKFILIVVVKRDRCVLNSTMQSSFDIIKNYFVTTALG